MKRFKGILFALISSTTFGLVPFFSINLLDEGIHAYSILTYRFGIGALILGNIALLRGQSFRITRQEAVNLFALGFLYALTSLGLILSYQYIPSGVATTIHFLYPVVVTGIMVLLFKEKRSPVLMLCALISLLGVGLLSWNGGESLSREGILLVLMTVVTYALYIVGVNKSDVCRIDSLPLTFFVLLNATAVLFAYASLTHGIQPLPTGRAALNAVLLALIPTVISNLTLVLAVKNVGSTVTAILGSMEPVTAVVVGICYFHEAFNGRYAAGLVLIIAAVTLVVLQGGMQKRKRRKRKNPLRKISEAGS